MTMQGNKQKVAVNLFKKKARAFQHAAIYECYMDYNRKGGCVMPLQTGEKVIALAVVHTAYVRECDIL
jgi:hypothetical protein